MVAPAVAGFDELMMLPPASSAATTPVKFQKKRVA